MPINNAIKVNFTMVWSMGKESITTLKANFILVIGLKIKSMVKAIIFTKTGKFMKELFRTIWNMDKEKSKRKMEAIFKAFSMKIIRIKQVNIMMPLKRKNT